MGNSNLEHLTFKFVFDNDENQELLKSLFETWNEEA
jgi:hypothetical protein